MLTLQQIKEDPERIIARLAVKGFDGKQGVNDVIDFDDQRKSLQFQSDNLGAELKKKADSIGRLMKEGRRDEAEEVKKEVAAMKEQQKELNDRLTMTEKAIRDILLGMPNVPCDMVPPVFSTTLSSAALVHIAECIGQRSLALAYRFYFGTREHNSGGESVGYRKVKCGAAVLYIDVFMIHVQKRIEKRK